MEIASIELAATSNTVRVEIAYARRTTLQLTHSQSSLRLDQIRPLCACADSHESATQSRTSTRRTEQSRFVCLLRAHKVFQTLLLSNTDAIEIVDLRYLPL